MKISFGLASVTLLLSMLDSPVFAGTNGFFVPFFRGATGSQAGYWETFTVPVGVPGNLADRPGATTGAVLTQSDTNAFLTGSGNVYNLNGVSAFVLSDSTPFNLGTVVLQIRTLGSELDYGSVVLNYTNGSGPQSLLPLRRVELNRANQPGLGATVSSLWQWDLSGLNVTSYTISFRAVGVSLSFDSMTLDTTNQFIPLFTPLLSVNSPQPSIERWMYPFNAAPCDRPAGSVFGSFGDAAGVDTRHAQHLIGWDTAALAPTNRGPTNYLITRCRLTLTINRGNLFVYDPSQDNFRTYFETDHPSFLPDNDAGRPIELFGAAFRNGYNAVTFDQCAPFGTNTMAQRNAYAAGWSTNGTLVDMSNNVGKTNDAFPRFEVAPFAIGQTTNVAPGELVPAGAKITFDLNLNDPFVLTYVQEALNSGRLRLMVSALHVTAGQFGAPSYPDFVTRFNEATPNPTRLELEGVVVGTGDVDMDGLPDDWELFYLNTLTHNTAGDPDSDGVSNLAEFRAGTNPFSNTSTLRIISFDRDTNGRVALRVLHSSSRRYAVEFTDNFSTWNTLTNLPVFDLSTGMATWLDNAPESSKRFYRVRSEVLFP
jgi:hypothetical protein